MKGQSKPEAKEYCRELLISRKEKKDLIFAPTQVELRTLMMPPVQVYNSFFDNYYKLCEEVGLISRYKKPEDKISVKNQSSSKIYVDTREQKPLDFKNLNKHII